ncbi:unnamed protein product, partial [Laminaria digitata]
MTIAIARVIVVGIAFVMVVVIVVVMVGILVSRRCSRGYRQSGEALGSKGHSSVMGMLMSRCCCSSSHRHHHRRHHHYHRHHRIYCLGYSHGHGGHTGVETLLSLLSSKWRHLGSRGHSSVVGMLLSRCCCTQSSPLPSPSPFSFIKFGGHAEDHLLSKQTMSTGNNMNVEFYTFETLPTLTTFTVPPRMVGMRRSMVVRLRPPYDTEYTPPQHLLKTCA